jgi:hemerythrin-like metal-binding protein
VNRFNDASKEVADKTKNTQLLNELIQYTLTHFSDEEKFMESIGYPGINEHKMQHKWLVTRVTEFKAEFDAGTGKIDQKILIFLKSWIMNHIQSDDIKYGNHANQKKKSA